MKRYMILLTAWLLCCAVQPLMNAMAEETRMETYTLDQHGPVYAYLPEALEEGKRYPLVIALNCTTGDPQGEVTGNGWDAVVRQDDVIVVAPTYNDYATWSETGYIKSVIDDAVSRYPVDSGRIYATGFSNGGALSGALAATYPDLLAGISAMGWMIPLGEMDSHSRLPFLLIQGTEEFTRKTASGSKAIMEDEEGALNDLFARNGLFSGEQTPDYNQTPYWGYPADEILVEYPDYRDIFSHAAHSGDVKWEISRYHHPDYSQPLAELILVEGADHIPHSCNARYAWDFLRHFARAEDGTIVEIDADRKE